MFSLEYSAELAIDLANPPAGEEELKKNPLQYAD
tara:strand:+ start:209 stop:310 length:102 start_codon:yes stop_codon:yes gene_type:complete